MADPEGKGLRRGLDDPDADDPGIYLTPPAAAAPASASSGWSKGLRAPPRSTVGVGGWISIEVGDRALSSGRSDGDVSRWAARTARARAEREEWVAGGRGGREGWSVEPYEGGVRWVGEDMGCKGMCS